MSGGGGFNVLNFGVGDYGTRQSLLRYETWALRGTLDHVFYVFYRNDLRNNLVSPLDDRWAIFRQLLRRFKAAAEGDGASFQMVRLPIIPCDAACSRAAEAGLQLPQGRDALWPSVAGAAAEEGVEIVDLQDCFAEQDPAHPRTSWWLSPYRFRRDEHWNEAGNRLAAVCLHRFLAGRLGLPPLSGHEVARALDRYYSAFEAPPHGAPANPAAAAIRTRYDALRVDDVADPPAVSGTPSPDKLVTRSHFDVYLDDGWLVYIREGCLSGDLLDKFFLHLVPRDLRDLSPDRLPHGFDNLDFRWRVADWVKDPWASGGASSDNSDGPANASICTAYMKLPDYAIEHIRTGQFFEPAQYVWQNLWEVGHSFPAGQPPTRSMP